jgi:BarA-like signal transduction histidine kinase
MHEVFPLPIDSPDIFCDAEEKTRQLGIQGCLMKPISMAELAKQVRQVFDQNKLNPGKPEPDQSAQEQPDQQESGR